MVVFRNNRLNREADEKDPAAKRKKVEESLKFSIYDGSFYGIMDSFTTPFITPFALFLNCSNLMVSLIVSLPGMIASMAQFAAIKVEELLRSRKRIVVMLAFLQAILWLPIMFIPYVVTQDRQPIVLLILVTLITVVGTFINPFWKGMMGDLVPEDERGRYFSRRNLIIGIVSFVSLYLAGLILQAGSSFRPVAAFCVLFSAAFISRLFSAFFLNKMYEQPISLPVKKGNASFLGFIRELPSDPYGRFVLFLSSFRIAIFIASPFFSVYMLKVLGFSYLQFTVLTSVEIFANLLLLQFWGHYNDEHGSKNILFITGFMIPLLPLLWTFNHSFWYLMILQFYSGAVYSGFNLATDNFIFDATSPEDRTRKVAYFNLLHGKAVFLGSVLGGFLLRFMPIPMLFLVSFAARFGVALFLLPTLKEMRLVELDFAKGKSFFRSYIHIKPRVGGIHYESMGYYTPLEYEPVNRSYTKDDARNRHAHKLAYDDERCLKHKQGRFDTKEEKRANLFVKSLALFNKYRKIDRKD